MQRSLFVLALFYLLAISACNTSEDRKTNAAQAPDTLTLPQDEATLFFKAKPKWIDTITDAIDTSHNAYASQILFAMKEPLLRNYSGQREIYRFTWLRTFDHPVVITLEKNGSTIRLFSKMAAGIGASKPDSIIHDTTITVERQEFDQFLRLLGDINFWRMSSQEPHNGDSDGSEWIIEGFREGQYHAVLRWSPYRNKFGDCGKFFIQLSPLGPLVVDDIY